MSGSRHVFGADTNMGVHVGCMADRYVSSGGNMFLFASGLFGIIDAGNVAGLDG